jgi:hypothetical protein
VVAYIGNNGSAGQNPGNTSTKSNLPAIRTTRKDLMDIEESPIILDGSK